MNKLGKAVLIAGGMVTVGALSYLYGPITSISDAVMRLNVNAQDLVDHIVD